MVRTAIFHYDSRIVDDDVHAAVRRLKEGDECGPALGTGDVEGMKLGGQSFLIYNKIGNGIVSNLNFQR